MGTIEIFLLLTFLFFAILCYLTWNGLKDSNNLRNFNFMTGKKKSFLVALKEDMSENISPILFILFFLFLTALATGGALN